MDKVGKALEKLTEKERKKIKEILTQLRNRRIEHLNIKKLKGRDDIFRIRKGNIRIIYRADLKNNILILSISRRGDTTYAAD
ncbi:MAG: type II toxin-antitoxin system RelE/ParE family toxin [Candidatus Nealsonbacteria bacterium]